MNECQILVTDQLQTLAMLKKGWFDGDGEPYTWKALDKIERLLIGMLKRYDLSTPYIYPTMENEVRAEWTGSNWDAVVTFSKDVLTVRLLAVDAHGNSELRYTTYTDTFGIQQLGQLLQLFPPARVL